MKNMLDVTDKKNAYSMLDIMFDNLEEFIPNYETYWEYYGHCAQIRHELLLDQETFNKLAQKARELYFKRKS